MATADRVGATLIIANDPDADRMAVAEKAPAAAGGAWRVFTGNETGVLLAHWLWTKRAERVAAAPPSPPSALPPLMIASTVSSKMLAAFAEAESFAFQETLTGFKWMGNASECRWSCFKLHPATPTLPPARSGCGAGSRTGGRLCL